MARKTAPEDCMFCAIGDCPDHAPKKPKVSVPKVAKDTAPPSSRRGPVATDRGSVRDSPDSAPGGVPDPRPPSAVSQLQKEDTDGEDVLREAALCLLRSGLLDIEEVQARRIALGPANVDRYIKAHKWKRRVNQHGEKAH